MHGRFSGTACPSSAATGSDVPTSAGVICCLSRFWRVAWASSVSDCSLTDTETVTSGSFLRWTGHQAVITSVFGLGMVGCLMVLSVEPLEWIDLNRPIAPWVLLSGFTLAIPALAGLCLFLRCPQCRERVVWNAVSKGSHPGGMNALLASAQCPSCGFSSASTKQTKL